MADFTIASQVGGGGGGQNALAGSGGFNPNAMFQLMQMKQTMELQRLAEQRAAAAEGRAAAQHGLTMQRGQLELGTAQRAEKEALDAKALSDRYFDLIGKHDNPYAPEVLNPFKKTDPKFYTYMSARKLEQDKLAAEASENTVKSAVAAFDYVKKSAPLLLANIDRVKDQASYEKIYDEVAKGSKTIPAVIPRVYSPENVAALKSSLESVQEMKQMSMANGDIGIFVGGQLKAVVDPQYPGGARPVKPVDQSAIVQPNNTAPTGAQPRAAAPQTMQFSGMGQLAPAGQQAAQAVMSAFPGARITSGYRSPQKNTDVGGAPRSYHLTGNAIDVVPPAGMPMNVFAAKLQAQLGPMGYTVMYGDPGHLDHVHIQPGNAMNVPREFSPSVAATDVAAGRQPMGMMAPANAMVPLAAMSLMQPQNAMVQTPANIAPGLTAAATPAVGVAAPATTPAGASEERPVRSPDETYGAYTKRLERWETEQAEIRKERRKAEEAAKPKQLTPMQEKKLRDDVATDHKATMTTLEKVDMAVKTINKFRELPDDQKDKILGYSGALTPNISGAAKQAYTRFKDIEGQVTSMGKDLATLSGAIGSIANQEWGIMRDQVASIDLKNMDVKTLNQQLDRIEAMAKGIANRARDSYRRQYQEELQRFGDRFNIPETTKTPVRTGTYGGKKVVEYSDGTIDYAD